MVDQGQARLIRRPAGSRNRWISRHLRMIAHLAATGYLFDPGVGQAYAELAWEPAGGNPSALAAAAARQIQAIQGSGDHRTDYLRPITAPTLVVHGDRARIVQPSGGRATAEAIPSARLVSLPGMGHHLAPGLLERLVEIISSHAREAGA